MKGSLAVSNPDLACVIGPTRRLLIGRFATAIGLAGVLGQGLTPRPAAAASAKLQPTDIGYQAKPRGGLRCEQCVNWQAPSSCQVVAGVIDPNGWCGLFRVRT